MSRSPALKLLPVGEDILSGADRRIHPRLQPAWPLTCQVKMPGRDAALRGTVQNLSAGGLALLVDHPVPPGTRIQVQMANLAHTIWLSLMVTILRSEPERSGNWFLGGEFDRTLMPEELKPFVW